MMSPFVVRSVAIFGLLAGAILPAGVGCAVSNRGGSKVCLQPVAPPALRIGGVVAIVAPGHPLVRERVEQAIGRLERMGFRTKIVGDVYSRRGYLAGSDAARADALMTAYRDPQVNALFCGTGGYGTTRLLEQLDFDVIRRHPKILLGFSDVTALHLAIANETGQITFHGPNLMWGLGSPDRNLTPFASVHLWRLLCPLETLEAIRTRVSADESAEPIPGLGEGPLASVPPMSYDLSLLESETPSPAVLQPGRCQGRLIGGNLSLVAALMGTRWEIETDGRILFLEDVSEAPYRIDRYLRQLKQAGKLDRVAGVILGRWHECVSDKPENETLTLEDVFSDYFADAPYPVVTGFPLGHVRDNATLPVNAMAELDADSLTLTILEPVVH